MVLTQAHLNLSSSTLWLKPVSLISPNLSQNGNFTYAGTECVRNTFSYWVSCRSTLWADWGTLARTKGILPAMTNWRQHPIFSHPQPEILGSASVNTEDDFIVIVGSWPWTGNSPAAWFIMVETINSTSLKSLAWYKVWASVDKTWCNTFRGTASQTCESPSSF